MQIFNKFIIIFLFLSIGFECIADYFIKKWSLTLNSRYFLSSLLMYNLMLLSWTAIVFKTKEISLVGTIWLLLCHLGLIFVGIGIFQEPITMKQGIGIALAMIALVLISI